MRLEMTSMDGTSTRAKLRRAIVQLEHAKSVALSQMVSEANQTARRLIGAIDDASRVRSTRDSGHFMWGSFGAQISPDKVNGLSGMVVAYEEAIQLLREVYAKEEA